MASENDKKIKTLLEAIDKKKKSMGTKPKGGPGAWKSNGIIKGTNINTLGTEGQVVDLAAELVSDMRNYVDACEALEVDSDKEKNETFKNQLEDLKLRLAMIRWETEKKKLTAMEKKLKDLRSEDLRTSDELDDLTKSLGL